MSDRYDVIVIGGGHNGITTAALLAKRGRGVLVVERRDRVGGLAAGEEFYPGHRTAGVLHDTHRVRPWVIDALGLRGHGLSTRTDERPTLLPERQGDGMVLFRDPDRAADELSRRSAADVRRYRDFREFLARIAPTFRRLADRSAPDLFETGLGDLVHMGRAALSLRMLGRNDMMEVLRITPMCVADWLGEFFETDLLRAGLAWAGTEGCFAGPWSPGTNANLLWTESTAAASVAGGPCALIDALERAATAHGVQIRCGESVEEVTFDGGRVSGVSLRGGERLVAPIVAASCDPRHLFLDLVPAFNLSLELEGNITSYRARGTTAKVNLALTGYPEFSSRPGLEAERIRIGETVDELERAFDPVKYRRFSRRPALDIWVPTVETPELAPAGQHVFSILVHCVPYELDGSWNDASREELYRTVVGTLAEYAPEIEGAIVGHQVLTPLDLESSYGVSGGHLYHGEHAIDQLVVRPTPECMGYATPFEGLFLCGSGSHPGGGITCAPGALAARAILASSD